MGEPARTAGSPMRHPRGAAVLGVRDGGAFDRDGHPEHEGQHGLRRRERQGPDGDHVVAIVEESWPSLAMWYGAVPARWHCPGAGPSGTLRSCT